MNINYANHMNIYYACYMNIYYASYLMLIPTIVIILISFLYFSPFSVSPPFGNVKIYENCQVNVEFFPQKVGNYQGELLLLYDTGKYHIHTETTLSERKVFL